MNILISGGFGFIGSYMIKNFLSKGYNIGVLSRNIPIYASCISSSTDIYTADITEPINIDLPKRYDIFIHLASANDIDSMEPGAAINATTLGTKYSMDFCLKNRIRRFIYFSTFQVYGTSEGYVDEDTPVDCKNDYAITHFFAEEYVKMYSKRYGLEFIIVRPTNVYGALLNKNIDRWSLVPNCFCKEAFEKQTITLMSSGKQLRDFISLEDLSNITAILCENFETNKSEIINLARGQSTTILEAAQKVKTVYEGLFKKACIIDCKSNKPYESNYFKVNIEKIKKLGFAYSQEYTLEKEIPKIFAILEAD